MSAMAGMEVSADIKGTCADPYYEKAKEIVLQYKRPSISTVQRYLRIGYAHAAGLLEAMEGDILGPQGPNGVRPFLEKIGVEESKA